MYLYTFKVCIVCWNSFVKNTYMSMRDCDLLWERHLHRTLPHHPCQNGCYHRKPVTGLVRCTWHVWPRFPEFQEVGPSIC